MITSGASQSAVDSRAVYVHFLFDTGAPVTCLAKGVLDALARSPYRTPSSCFGTTEGTTMHRPCRHGWHACTGSSSRDGIACRRWAINSTDRDVLTAAWRAMPWSLGRPAGYTDEEWRAVQTIQRWCGIRRQAPAGNYALVSR